MFTSSKAMPRGSRRRSVLLGAALALVALPIAGTAAAHGAWVTTQLTTFAPAINENPQASPNGAWVYFQSNTTGKFHVFRKPTGGGSAQNLTSAHYPGNDNYGYALSPDGSKLLYTSLDPSTSQARVILANADGSSPVVLSPPQDYAYMSTFNSDATEVVYANAQLGYQIFLKDLGTGNSVNLTPGMVRALVPQFTPDDQKIVFVHNPLNQPNTSLGDIFSVDVDGTDLTNLTQNGLVAVGDMGGTVYPSLSPDGTKILYRQYVSGLPQLFSMNMNGTGKLQLTYSAAGVARAQYSPDGTRIAFIQSTGSHWQLFVMDSDGTDEVPVTNFAGSIRVMDWAPSGDRIYYDTRSSGTQSDVWQAVE